ncbi:hypothetical protein ACFFX1_20760 [Dactylosporangium sucinum]|uniref:Uncharacterized protein n=1 Tax=Dactylosporangium sucinum TaxID=1424081 RepID=A0A917UDY8_9ACTN|nr:hypothetical protein [Dactylosporangium sucinum]GGM86519.1 hypothetical protein GCM10007977_105530 [Dactylosporangium sucinum]
MGYSFVPEDPLRSGFGLSSWQMQDVRLVMLEAGVVTGGGLEQVIDPERFPPAAETMPVDMFSSNSGWQISPQQCAFIAGRLRAALAADLVGDLALYLEDLRPELLREWVADFAAFNERAAAWGGYSVR